MLFNKSSNGTTELREHIGFLYATVKFDNIQTDIMLAEEEIVKLIGKEIVTLASDHYNSSDYQLPGNDNAKKILDKLVQHIQLPVALLASRSFSRTTDVSHEETGRKMKLKEAEKMPFEWLLNRDDMEILNKANLTIDRLINFLDENIENIPIKDVWGVSDQYKRIKKLFFQSVSDFDDYYPINKSSRFFFYIAPFIAEMERKHILPIITKERFDIIKEHLLDKDIKDGGNEEALEVWMALKPALALLSMKAAAERLSIEILPEGLFKNNDTSLSGKQPAGESEKIAFISRIKEAAESELSVLQNLIASYNPDTTIIDTTVRDYTGQSFVRM